MTIQLLQQTATTSRRLLRSAYPRYFSVSSTVTIDARKVHSRRCYSKILSSGELAPKNNMVSNLSSSLVLSVSNRRRRPCGADFGHDRQESYRDYSGSSKNQIFLSIDQLPPSSSSILKQEDHELSATEVRLKKALQERMQRKDFEKAKLPNDQTVDYLLEELQRAYMDLEYWEEALKIEVYKCQTYLSEGTDEYADSIHAQGKFYLRQENFTNSKQLYEQALEYFEQTDNLVQQGHVLISLAGWYFFRNQLDDALESLQRSETMLDSNPALLYKCLDNQGLVYRLWGEFHVALDKYQQALQVVGADDSETRSALKMHIADMHLALEQPKDALNVFQELLMELPSTSTGNPDQHQLGMRGVMLHNIATIHVDLGDNQLALELFLEALEAKKSAGGEHNPEVAKTLNSLGALHAGSFGEKEVALEYFQQALLIARIHAEDGENPRDDPDVMNVLQNISVIEQDLARDQ